jgi:hypothetical protein
VRLEEPPFGSRKHTTPVNLTFVTAGFLRAV